MTTAAGTGTITGTDITLSWNYTTVTFTANSAGTYYVNDNGAETEVSVGAGGRIAQVTVPSGGYAYVYLKE